MRWGKIYIFRNMRMQCMADWFKKSWIWKWLMEGVGLKGLLDGYQSFKFCIPRNSLCGCMHDEKAFTMPEALYLSQWALKEQVIRSYQTKNIHELYASAGYLNWNKGACRSLACQRNEYVPEKWSPLQAASRQGRWDQGSRYIGG